MRYFIGLICLSLSIATAAFAQDTSPLRKLLTSDDSRGWEAVGRLNIAGRGMCTGALIAPDLVLTAAHCLFDSASKRQVDARKIEFLAGWRNGRATAYAWAKRAVVHPDYVYSTEVSEIRVRNDLALLQLQQPIRKSSITPFETDSRPRKGAEVGIVSYAHDRAESPSIQESCRVLARRSGTLVLSCEVDFGSSGAPVFVITDGQPRIVSVVSAKAEVGNRKVSLGTSLTTPLAVLMAELKAMENVFQKPVPTIRRQTLGSDDRSTGAKFLRP